MKRTQLAHRIAVIRMRRRIRHMAKRRQEQRERIARMTGPYDEVYFRGLEELERNG